jgi:hypothetical protein
LICVYWFSYRNRCKPFPDLFNKHGAAAPQYDALQPGKDYKDEMVESGWKAIMPEIHSFNNQMRKALKDAKVPHIYEAID